MASSGDKTDGFNHQLAIKLSRALNTINPNDLLAQRVTDIAKTNTVEGFTKGMFCANRSASISIIDIVQLPGLLASSKTLFWLSYMPKYYRMQSRRLPVSLHNLSKASQSMIATYSNQNLSGKVGLHGRKWCVS
jgi:hypothetical protein